MKAKGWTYKEKSEQLSKNKKKEKDRERRIWQHTSTAPSPLIWNRDLRHFSKLFLTLSLLNILGYVSLKSSWKNLVSLTVYSSANLATVIPVPDVMYITCFIVSVIVSNRRNSELHSLLWSTSSTKREEGLVSAFPPLRRAPWPIVLVFIMRISWLVSDFPH